MTNIPYEYRHYKNENKVLANWSSLKKKGYNITKQSLSQESKVSSPHEINLIHINEMNDKYIYISHMNFSIIAEKAFWENPTSFKNKQIETNKN